MIKKGYGREDTCNNSVSSIKEPADCHLLSRYPEKSATATSPKSQASSHNATISASMMIVSSIKVRFKIYFCLYFQLSCLRVAKFNFPKTQIILLFAGYPLKFLWSLKKRCLCSHNTLTYVWLASMFQHFCRLICIWMLRHKIFSSNVLFCC